MANGLKFKMSLNIGKTNEERIEAFEMYQKAFAAKKHGKARRPMVEISILIWT